MKIIANKLGGYQEIDLGKQESHPVHSFTQDDLCVIDVPSYGGRVPSVFPGNHS
ncbi:MAG: hypothetical protein UI647_04825 [Negativibacillus sp.]